MGQSRFVSRQRIIQALYQWQITKEHPDVIAQQFLDSRKRMRNVNQTFFLHAFNSITQQSNMLDAYVNQHSDRDSYSIGQIERATMRLAAWELLNGESKAIAIDQALELAQLFGCEESRPFINAVLDKIPSA